MMSFLAARTARFIRWAGVDGAVGYTALARACSIVSSVGTVLLLVRFLSPTEQGYYYTLLSFVLFQTVLELGFSFVIQQHAAHESIRCVFSADGRVEGDPVAHSRLASVLKLAVRWYVRAAIAIALLLLPAGFVFFSRKEQVGVHVAWQGPWIAVVLASAASFLLVPLFSFLEGCNQVRQVAQARFAQALVVLAVSWTAMISRHGLYAPALVNLGAVLVGVVFLSKRRRLLLGLFRYPAREHAVSWRDEIWPFQWRLAISWFCCYFTTQIFTPVLFLARGPVEAGRMGMSINIVAYLPIVVLSWMTTKATPFGQLISRGRLQELDHLFFRTLRQSLLLLVLLTAGCLAAVIEIQHLFRGIAARMEPPVIFVFLLVTAISTFTVQSMAIYLRSFKKEPYLLQSLLISSLTAASVMLVAPRWGSWGIAVSYLLFTGFLGLITGTTIFRAKRKLYGQRRKVESDVEANALVQAADFDILTPFNDKGAL
jgi:O-antigen/teichoic acid export membrane protein